MDIKKKKEICEISDVFSSSLKRLLRMLQHAYPDNVFVDRLCKRVFLSLDLVPDEVIRIVGKKISEHKDKIIDLKNSVLNNHVEEFIVKNSFKMDIDKATDREKKELAAEVIPLIQEHIKSQGIEERTEGINYLIKLYDSYNRYCKLTS